MLKGLSPLLTPELLKILSEMGHGDEIVLADGNFPSEAIGKRVVRLDAHTGTDVLKAVMSVFPLDTYSDPNAMLMEVVPGDNVETPIWDEYSRIMNDSGNRDGRDRAVCESDTEKGCYCPKLTELTVTRR